MMSSHRTNTLEANLYRHRVSNFQMIAKKLVTLEAGYEGNFNFMDGSPSMFWIHQESLGLAQLQNYLRVCYGSKEGDGGGEGLGIGSQVLAKYSVDELFYRARVQEVVLQDPAPGESMYSVCYVDYGNSEVVSGMELMTWDSLLDLLPEQAVACCLEEAPAAWREEARATWREEAGATWREEAGATWREEGRATWREEARATWTPEQLEAFQRTMRRGELKVRLRRELRQDKDPRKARFEALVWLEGESLLQILKRQSLFADDLASWEPGERALDSQIAKLAISQREMLPRGKSIGELSILENTNLTPRLPHSTAPVLLAKNESGLRKLEPGGRGGLRGILGDAGNSLMSPGTGGDAIVKQESLGGRKVPHSIEIVREPGTNPDNETEAPGSPVPSPLLKKSKDLVENWFNYYQIEKSSEVIPSAPVNESNVAKASSQCNSDIVNFAEPPIGEE